MATVNSILSIKIVSLFILCFNLALAISNSNNKTSLVEFIIRRLPKDLPELAKLAASDADSIVQWAYECANPISFVNKSLSKWRQDILETVANSSNNAKIEMENLFNYNKQQHIERFQKFMDKLEDNTVDKQAAIHFMKNVLMNDEISAHQKCLGFLALYKMVSFPTWNLICESGACFDPQFGNPFVEVAPHESPLIHTRWWPRSSTLPDPETDETNIGVNRKNICNRNIFLYELLTKHLNELKEK